MQRREHFNVMELTRIGSIEHDRSSFSYGEEGGSLERREACNLMRADSKKIHIKADTLLGS